MSQHAHHIYPVKSPSKGPPTPVWGDIPYNCLPPSSQCHMLFKYWLWASMSTAVHRLIVNQGTWHIMVESGGKPRNTKSSRTFRCNNCCVRDDWYKNVLETVRRQEVFSRRLHRGEWLIFIILNSTLGSLCVILFNPLANFYKENIFLSDVETETHIK